MWFFGLYDYEADAGTAPVGGLGTSAVSMANSRVKSTWVSGVGPAQRD